MSTLPCDSQERAKAGWTPAGDAFLIELLIEQERQGNRGENGFEKAAWKAISDIFNQKHGLQFSQQQLKSHFNILKKQYLTVTALLDQNGFSWDDTLHTVTATENVWDQYIMAHPDAKKFRGNSLPVYRELCKIFGSSFAEGRKQLSTVHLNLSDGATIEGAATPVTARATTILPIVHRGNLESGSSSGKENPSGDSERDQHQSAMLGTTRRRKRMRVNVGDRILDCMESLILQSEQLNAPGGASTLKEDSYYKCLVELQELEGLEHNEILQAVEVLKDDLNRVAFRALKGDIRLKWLKVQCRVQ
ncbi:L10-interacting MYB domain-containing protein-like [Magnolia sinica]|uniref:L10-interacting MYB domain-containing protein-like n=1 Tax=Magnolia sinica TaxID=86752 RepID=UPI00265A85CB|nr:L10-interacting MYB domain-containing protein-like [Magnolia sinica]XP_058082969.1 L10-interacting MYB domain-containing protein-like [Magnolia sinica]